MRSVPVLGVPIAVTSLAEAAASVEQWARERRRSYVCLVNVHVIETAQRSPELMEALRAADLALPDGAPVAWAATRAGSWKTARVAGSDLMAEVCRRTAGTLRHYLLGGTPQTQDRLSCVLTQAYPGLEICGASAPPFRVLSASEEAAIARDIDESGAEIVWVGLGAPRQELWMRRMREQLKAPVLVGVGAAFDFLSGTKPRAPEWVQRAGLEWAHRLASEPGRLWRRYLVTNTAFVARLVWAAVRERAGVGA